MTQLERTVGLPGAFMMGLGSIVGTGVFVSLGLAVGAAGPAMLLALVFAAFLAICNGLSTAQLAADHPVSGGTYEYGYKYVNDWVGFAAGWMFVVAKSASAATAALGIAGYVTKLLGADPSWQLPLTLIAIASVVGLTLTGLKRSSLANSLIVGFTLVVLLIFIFASLTSFDSQNLVPFFESQRRAEFHLPDFFETVALLFVAYTGYGRVATLGEEIKDPRRNIPRAIAFTLLGVFVLYFIVALAALGAVGADVYYTKTITSGAPLQYIANRVGGPVIANIVAAGAITAMLGVLLNLVLGVSRVVFAMGRRGDLFAFTASVHGTTKNPVAAILVTGVVILAIATLKDIELAWSFSAFTVLIYYSITNISALRLPPAARLYPRVFAWMGLAGCLGMSVWVNVSALSLGGIVLALGLLWRLVFRMAK